MVNTLILNAFHCTRLLSSEQYLENCKSYRLWKKKLNHVSGGFREFLGRVAARISRSDFEIGPCDSDKETRTREAVNEWTKIGTPLGVQPTYKVVEAKYLRGAGHDKRLRKGAYANAPEHTMVSTMNTKGCCALCCKLCEKKRCTHAIWVISRATNAKSVAFDSVRKEGMAIKRVVLKGLIHKAG